MKEGINISVQNGTPNGFEAIYVAPNIIARTRVAPSVSAESVISYVRDWYQHHFGNSSGVSIRSQPSYLTGGFKMQALSVRAPVPEGQDHKAFGESICAIIDEAMKKQ